MTNTLKNSVVLSALSVVLTVASANGLFSQTRAEGYVFETNNRGFLNQAKVSVLNISTVQPLDSAYSDPNGRVVFSLKPGRYLLKTEKELFFERTDTLTVGDTVVFLKLPMQRKPGYLLDATISESRHDANIVVDAISDATIEIYNRTRDTVELVLDRHPEAFFRFTLEQGNHYTILIRKPGYLAKRIEVFVNVEDCILCIHGLNDLRPAVSENLTSGNTMGTLLANIELERATVNKILSLKNIYYDLDKWDIRPDAAKELDQTVQFLKDNPQISVELGSHSDARGPDDYNLQLSQKRADSAVAYIVESGIDSSRISAKGYGESQPVNDCRDDVPCTETQHAANRRTELRITGISEDDLQRMRWKSLEAMIREAQNEQTKKTNQPK